MRLSAVLSGFAATMLFATAAGAATWQPVAESNGERVEIDKGRILRTAEGKTTAWTRLKLGRDMNEGGVTYDAVLAMNRYDCAGRSYATVKRVYMRADKVVRQETVAKPRDLAISSGSVDQRLFAEACKLRTVGEAQRVAEAAAQVAEQSNAGKPGVMHADMRMAAGSVVAKTIPVADAGAPDVKAETGAEAKPAQRPRFIELPKIDKSQVEDPYAGAKPAEARTAEKTAEKVQPKPVDKSVAKPTEKASEKPAAAPVDRRVLERQYATSGPRRARVVRSPAAEPAPVVSHGYAHWSYDGEGAPANWAKLRGDFATCGTGRRQSPIDIRDGIRVDLEPIAFDYRLTQFLIVDNGHTIQVNVGEGSTISVMGRTYQLKQFHFHKPGEERVSGRTYDMGVHFVHQDDDGKLAVVALLLEKGAENSLIQTLWNNMPLEVDQEVAPAVAIDLKAFLPENRAYYTYMGSLTTPPCTEDVLWMVLKQSMPVSPDQVAIFSRLYKNNARPVQPSNGRLIKESR